MYSLWVTAVKENIGGWIKHDGAADSIVAAILRLDARNPQVAARLTGAVNGWQNFDAALHVVPKRILQTVEERATSGDVKDIASRLLKGGM